MGSQGHNLDSLQRKDVAFFFPVFEEELKKLCCVSRGQVTFNSLSALGRLLTMFTGIKDTQANQVFRKEPQVVFICCQGITIGICFDLIQKNESFMSAFSAFKINQG